MIQLERHEQVTEGSGALPSAIVREVDSPTAMVELGRLLGMRLHAGDVVLLSGDLGAGKTTLMRDWARGWACGARSPVRPSSSPGGIPLWWEVPI
ncbi:MAG: tRNA (adenosine(37)-N6)-threonylcarbamoyltransferase complex ATPase subunit type 1 TsaE [Candidatus Nanopelagicales bacterium]